MPKTCAGRRLSTTFSFFGRYGDTRQRYALRRRTCCPNCATRPLVMCSYSESARATGSRTKLDVHRSRARAQGARDFWESRATVSLDRRRRRVCGATVRLWKFKKKALSFWKGRPQTRAAKGDGRDASQRILCGAMPCASLPPPPTHRYRFAFRSLLRNYGTFQVCIRFGDDFETCNVLTEDGSTVWLSRTLFHT